VRRFLTTHVPVEGDLVTMDGSTSHHLLRVTGIAPGERVEIFDGQGAGAVAELVDVQDGLAVLRVLHLQGKTNEDHRVHLVLGQTRANVLDATLRMVTELGVSSIQIVGAERCVANGDKRDRWQRILESAAGQSGRVTVPQLMVPVSLSHALSERSGVRIVFAPGGAPAPKPTGDVHLLVGPEGGLTDRELQHAAEAGWIRSSLGSTILRADTAAVAAVVRYGS